MDITTKLKVVRFPNSNILRMEQEGGRNFFTASDKLLLISIDNLAYILKFLIVSGLMSKKVLEGILSEINTEEVK